MGGPELFEQERKFSLEDLLFRNRIPVTIFLVGVVLVGAGIIVSRQITSPDPVVVLESSTGGQEDSSEVVVEVAGEVVSPGVYKLSSGARIEDLLVAAGGLSAGANRDWVDKNLNRAAKITDGSKIYIPGIDEQSTGKSANSVARVQTISSPRGSGLVDVNTASKSELEELPGIGPVYAQSVIEHRPYSTVEDLLTSGALRKSTFDKVKDLVAVY